MRRNIARYVLATQPFLHPRLYTWLVRGIWPALRENDGFLPVRYGEIEMRLDLREGAEQEIFCRCYDPPLTKLVQRVCAPGEIVVDVGANVGIVSVTAANAVGPTGRVLCVEPNPVLVTRLERLAETNPLGNIEIFPCALGECSGRLTLHQSSSHPYSTLDPNYLPNYPVAGEVKVEVLTLDALVRAAVLTERISLLKLDAQGHENRILQGARAVLGSNPPAIIVLETVQEGLDEILAALSGFGYTRHVLDDGDGLVPAMAVPAREGENMILMHASAPGLT